MRRRKLSIAMAPLALWTALVLAQGPSQVQQFQEAIHVMETKGDYAAAIRLFEAIAGGPDRVLAARALLHIGLCYEKLGKEEALKAYQRLLREFADQADLAAEARARLVALDRGANSIKSSLAVRRVWTGPEVNFTGVPSPDGKYLSYGDWETGDLAVRDLATGQKRRLTNNGAWTGEFVDSSMFSPDSKQVAYAWVFGKDSYYSLRVVGLDGSNPRVLYRNAEVGYISPTDWSADGKHILARFFRHDGTHQIVLVSVADGSPRVLKTLDWRSPLKMSLSPDGRYVAYDFPQKEDSPNRDIFVLAADGSHERPLVEHPANDFVLDFTPDGRSLLFASDRMGTMGAWVMQVANGKRQGSPELVKPDIGNIRPMGFTQKGSFYYGLLTGLQDVYITELDLATGRLLAPPKPVSQRFVGSNISPEWSPDGKSLVYISRWNLTLGEQGSRSLVVRSVETGEEHEFSLKLLYVNNLRLAWSPDGRHILASGWDQRRRNYVYEIDARTGDATPIVQSDPGAYIRQAISSRDGKEVIYNANNFTTNTSHIFVRNLETGQNTELYRTDLSSFVSYFDLSPDGQQVAFISSGKVLNVMPAAGGEPRELLRVQEPEAVMQVAWTPDGRQVLFAKRRAIGPQEYISELWRIPMEGGEPQSLGLTMSLLPHMRSHPDGRRLAFTAGGQPKSEVWVMENLLSAPRKRNTPDSR